MLKKFVKMLRLIKKSAYVIYEWPLSQELGSRLQQIGDVTKALEVLLYCLELDRGIVSHSEFDPNAEFEANDPRGRLFASSKGRSIIAESLKQVVQSR